MTTPPSRHEQGEQRTGRRRTTALIAAGVALIVAGGVAGGLWWTQRDDPEMAVDPNSYVPPSDISSSTSSSSSSSSTSSTSSTKSSSSSSSSTTSESTSPTSTSTSTSPSSTSTTSAPVNQGQPQGDPSRVVVTSGGRQIVDASLQATVLDEQDVLAPPFGTAGWYAEPGWPKPGYQGASILVGHINHGSQPDVFWNLPKVNIGDTVTVTYTSGDKVQFVITKSKAAPKSGVPQNDSIWDHDNPEPVLRLITCDPQTDFEDGHYAGNWVVWAKLA